MSESEPPDKPIPSDRKPKPSGSDLAPGDRPPAPDAVVEAIKGILAEMGITEEDPRLRIILTEVRTAVSYRGPIPPPEMLAGYEQIYPGLAKEIVDAWHEQRTHRMSIEDRSSRGGETRMDRSQRNSLIVSLAGLGVALVGAIIVGWLFGVLVAVIAIGGPNAATIVARFMSRPSG